MSNIFYTILIISAALVAVLAKKDEVPEVKLLNRRVFKTHPHPTTCKELGKCCQGKDNSCRIKTVVKKLGEVHSEEDRPLPQNTTTCFCDSACLTLDDCCPDYHEVCKPVDCQVSNSWDEWGECSKKCGSGIKERHLKVTQEPLNGGKPCPTTLEKIPCEGNQCKHARASFLRLKDTAHIISSKFGPWRISSEYHPRKGIRKNLFDRYSANVTERPSYCIVFKLTHVESGCNDSTDNLAKLGFDAKDIEYFQTSMVKDGEVCVECQDIAMKNELGGRCTGDGVVGEETRWSIHSSCRGKWKMVSKKDQCTCGKKQDGGSRPSFLFI